MLRLHVLANQHHANTAFLWAVYYAFDDRTDREKHRKRTPLSRTLQRRLPWIMPVIRAGKGH